MLSSRNQLVSVAYVRSYTKSGLILPGQVLSVWDPSDPTSKQMANYFTHPDQIPVSKGEKLDNAIEADPPDGKIDVMLSDKDGRLLFTCTNSYAGDVRIADDGSFITHKDDSRNHGLGIRNIREAVARMGGTVDISARDGIFTVRAEIKLDGEKHDTAPKLRKTT